MKDDAQNTRMQVPSSVLLGKLDLSKLEYDVLNPLFVVDDVLQVGDYVGGCVHVKKGAFRVNGVSHDVAAGGDLSSRAVTGFYSIPVRASESDVRGVIDEVFERFCDSGVGRHFVVTETCRPYLVDVLLENGITLAFTPYLQTSFARMELAGEAGQRFRLEVEGSVRELGSASELSGNKTENIDITNNNP